ncbi:hypothetical protein MASR1M45_09200 [Candidatus Kapaibacterium sp.]
MLNINNNTDIGVIGAGTMGSGIAQVAASAGHAVYLYDANFSSCEKAIVNLKNGLNKLVDKGKLEQKKADSIISNIHIIDKLENFQKCGLIIEAIIEDLDVKRTLFGKLEDICEPTCIFASNTSSLSIGSISGNLKNPERFAGLHFFNPAQVLPLVEVVPSVLTSDNIINGLYDLMKVWGKTPVIAKDTPGFIVNKVARPYYGEALKIYEEGLADFSEIDFAMKSIGSFKMGPFELMDLIGNDVNYKVTETVFTEFYYDGRYKPSITQKRYAEAGLLGRKSGRGFYDYSKETTFEEKNYDYNKLNYIFTRILVMLINEAIDTLYRNIASKEDIDLAVIKGVNYPKGLLKWADELGLEFVYDELNSLYTLYLEDRYRPCPLLKKMIDSSKKFYNE